MLKIEIKTNDCMACGQCMDVCPTGAIEINDSGQGYNGCIINQEKCIQCGECLDIGCPGDAFSVTD